MSKKKRFSVSQALSQGLSETVTLAENSDGQFRNSAISVERLELDPENPRKLLITLDDVKNGLVKADPDFDKKSQELVGLQQLADTIKASGLLNPIIVFKFRDKYRVVAGERRTLASILANKTEIEARIFNEKPTKFDLKLLQWIENSAREDLSLADRIDNIREVIECYQTKNEGKKLTVRELGEIAGISKSLAARFMSAVKAPEDVWFAIQEEKITSLKVAELISAQSDEQKRKQLIARASAGDDLKTLKLLADVMLEKIATKVKTTATKKISFGSTKNNKVAQYLSQLVLSTEKFQSFSESFKSVNWEDNHQATKACQNLMKLIEEHVESLT